MIINSPQSEVASRVLAVCKAFDKIAADQLNIDSHFIKVAKQAENCNANNFLIENKIHLLRLLIHRILASIASTMWK